MLNTTSAYKSQIISPNRRVKVSVVLNGSTDLPLSKITLIKITKKGASQQALKPGELCRSLLEITSTESLTGFTEVFFEVTGATDKINLGKYWVNNAEYNATTKKYLNKLYDLPAWLDEVAVPTSTKVSDILTQIERSSGMTITGKELLTLTTVAEIEEGTTWLELLRDIVGYSGYSLRTNAGNLEVYKYTPVSYNITRDLIFMNGLTCSDETTISYYLVNGQYKSGTGMYGITYDNQFIKSDAEVTAMAHYIGQKYRPMSCKFKGDPSLQIGDIIAVQDAAGEPQTCMVMDYTMVFDGGFAMTVNCYSDAQQKYVISQSPSERKLNRVIVYAQDLVEKIAQTVIGQTDGLYRLIDKDGNVVEPGDADTAGWQIVDASLRKGWQFVLGGLSHSSDGFQTVDKVAITADGEILGTAIKAGTITLQSMSQSAIDELTYDDTEIKGDISDLEGGIASVEQNVNVAIDNVRLQALKEVQYIYYSTTVAAGTPTTPTTWVSDATGDQGKWTNRRPIYNGSYPIVWVCRQSRTLGSTVLPPSCTDPVVDQTTTVIDGGHITTGTIDAAVVNVINLVANNIVSGKISSKNGNVYFDLDNNEIACSKMVTPDNGSGHVNGVMTMEASSETFYTHLYVKGHETMTGLKLSANASNTSDMDRGYIQAKVLYLQTENDLNINGRGGLHLTSSLDYIEQSSFSVGMNSTHGFELGSSLYVKQHLRAQGVLVVTGTKSRLVDTPDYSERLLYCYETPSPMFGDIGEATLDEEGLCYLYLDDIFSETINQKIEYQVFLQKEGQGDCWIEEKNPTYFVIKGTPNLKVAWELKAIQRDYENIRLEDASVQYDEYVEYDNLDNTYNDDYVEEQERILYG